MKRLLDSPALAAAALIAGLAITGLIPGWMLGGAVALAFAVLWMVLIRRRRFTVKLSLACCLVALCIAALCRAPLAASFAAGSLASILTLLLTKRRRSPGSDVHVLLVTRHDAERVGGTETYLRNFLRSVDDCAAGVRVTFATFDQGSVHRHYKNAVFFTRPGGWFFRYARAHEEGIVRKNLWNAIVLLAVAIDLATLAIAASDENEVDVIYGVGGMIPNLAAILTSVALGKPVLCHFQLDFFFSRFSPPFRALLRTLFLRARFIVANTQASIDDFSSIGIPAERCIVILNWIFPEDFQGTPIADLRRSPSEKIALFVGRLQAEKGIELVLRAFDRVRGPIRLVIAGDGNLHDEVARWSDARTNVTWLGAVEYARMPDVLASADCLVWGSIDRDALSLAAIEALAAGLPVIASRRSNNMFERGAQTLPTTLPADVGILSEPDEDAIAAAIVDICSWDRDAVRVRCRAFVDANYSPANFDRLLEALVSLSNR